jgi:hypothetical protein
MTKHSFLNTDPYCYKGTDILINKKDIQDPKKIR